MMKALKKYYTLLQKIVKIPSFLVKIEYSTTDLKAIAFSLFPKLRCPIPVFLSSCSPNEMTGIAEAKNM